MSKLNQVQQEQNVIFEEFLNPDKFSSKGILHPKYENGKLGYFIEDLKSYLSSRDLALTSAIKEDLMGVVGEDELYSEEYKCGGCGECEACLLFNKDYEEFLGRNQEKARMRQSINKYFNERGCASEGCKDRAIEGGDFCRFHSDNLPV